jgi:hypothetical protein
MFQKLDIFPSSADGKETPTMLGPLDRANLTDTVTEDSSF